jgi:hypothetical protein
MKQYVERMVREKEDLAGKIKKAKAALEKRPFDMTDIGYELLKKQVEAMETYLNVLNQRIEYESGGKIHG